MPQYLLATQSIADVKDSPIASTILQSTATKIYLPNSEAGNESMREFYRYAGLNGREIEILQRALPKREYYFVHPLGRRLISFRLGPIALSFAWRFFPERSGTNQRIGKATRRRMDRRMDGGEARVKRLDRIFRRRTSRHAEEMAS